jgi:hypothetical protein
MMCFGVGALPGLLGVEVQVLGSGDWSAKRGYFGVGGRGSVGALGSGLFRSRAWSEEVDPGEGRSEAQGCLNERCDMREVRRQ